MDASTTLFQLLRELGLEVEVYKFPSDGSSMVQMYRLPIGWDVYDAYVKIVEPREKLLHRLSEAPTLVSLDSPPTNGPVEAEVVYVGNGERDEDYEGKNVNGKIVLAHGRLTSRVYKVAVKHGAIGVVHYRLWGNPKAVPYTSLWFNAEEYDKYKSFSIGISRENAEYILSLLEKGEKVKLEVYVDSRFTFGNYLPVVTATVGDGELEFWLTAHLCHPAPGAHDNLSGVAATVEALITLHKLIERGEIGRLKLRIRGVWGPEYIGYLKFIEKYENPEQHIVAGINMDMVGADTSKLKSTIQIVKSPYLITPSPLDMLVEEKIRERLKSGEISIPHFGPPPVVKEKFDVVGYSPGSDHDILIGYGIPSVMILEWPDEYYHSNLDLPENINFELLSLEASTASAIATYYAVLDEGEVLRLCKKLYYYTLNKFNNVMNHMYSSDDVESWSGPVRANIELLPLAFGNAVERLKHMLKCEFDMPTLNIENNVIEPINGELLDSEEFKVKYVSRYRGPISISFLRERLGNDYNRFEGVVKSLKSIMPIYLLLLSLGKCRSLGEAFKIVMGELGPVNLDSLKEAVDLLEKAGILCKVDAGGGI